MRTQLVLIFWTKDSCSSYENNACLKCINHFCRRSSVFENECCELESRQSVSASEYAAHCRSILADLVHRKEKKIVKKIIFDLASLKQYFL